MITVRNLNISVSLNERTNGFVFLLASKQPHVELAMVNCMTNTFGFGIRRYDREDADGRMIEIEEFKNGDERVMGISSPRDIVRDYLSYD